MARKMTAKSSRCLLLSIPGLAWPEWDARMISTVCSHGWAPVFPPPTYYVVPFPSHRADASAKTRWSPLLPAINMRQMPAADSSLSRLLTTAISAVSTRIVM